MNKFNVNSKNIFCIMHFKNRTVCTIWGHMNTQTLGQLQVNLFYSEMLLKSLRHRNEEQID
jgi:hypothetical protein